MSLSRTGRNSNNDRQQQRLTIDSGLGNLKQNGGALHVADLEPREVNVVDVGIRGAEVVWGGELQIKMVLKGLIKRFKPFNGIKRFKRLIGSRFKGLRRLIGLRFKGLKSVQDVIWEGKC